MGGLWERRANVPAAMQSTARRGWECKPAPPHSHRWKACCNPRLKRTVKLVSNATKHLSTVWTAVDFFPPQTILFLSSTFLQGRLGRTISHNQIKSFMTTASFYREKNKHSKDLELTQHERVNNFSKWKRGGEIIAVIVMNIVEIFLTVLPIH